MISCQGVKHLQWTTNIGPICCISICGVGEIHTQIVMHAFLNLKYLQAQGKQTRLLKVEDRENLPCSEDSPQCASPLPISKFQVQV